MIQLLSCNKKSVKYKSKPEFEDKFVFDKNKLFKNYNKDELIDLLVDLDSDKQHKINKMDEIELRNYLIIRLNETGAINAVSINDAIKIVSEKPDPHYLPNKKLQNSIKYNDISKHKSYSNKSNKMNKPEEDYVIVSPLKIDTNIDNKVNFINNIFYYFNF